MAEVVCGVLWAAEQAASKLAAAKAEFSATRHKGSVANISLGGGKSQALDEAVNKAIDSGMPFTVAAGNDNRNAPPRGRSLLVLLRWVTRGPSSTTASV